VEVLCALLTIFLIVLALRAILSWFPTSPGTFLAQLNSVLFQLTDWALRPMRRIIPPAGMFDLSFMVLFFLVLILRSIVCSS
jgi:YggT family protein